MAVTLHGFPVEAAGDATGLEAALREINPAAVRQMVILAKIPGPATLNDPSRELAQMVFRAALLRAGGEALHARCHMILSVGCEGIGSAGGWLLADDGASEPGPPRMVMCCARSLPIPAHARGMPDHVLAVAEATTQALHDAMLTPADVAVVLVKSPVRRDQANATGRSRGAAALGVAVALGEVAASQITAAAMDDLALFSAKAMTMSGTETEQAEIIVLANTAGAGGDLVIGSAVLPDLLDVGAARRLLRGLGGRFDDDGVLANHEDFGAVLLKAGMRPDGRLRGRTTHMHGTDMPADKHLRAAASGVLASLLGSNDAFITGGAEHQTPPGSCLLAAIAKVRP
jgi:cyanuric acid amidohydrolase